MPTPVQINHPDGDPVTAADPFPVSTTIDTGDLATEATLADVQTAVQSAADSLTTMVNDTSPAEVFSQMQFLDVTLSTDTSAYASGDLIADTQVVTDATRANDVEGLIQSITIIDEDDQGAAFDIYFLSANNTLGTENAAPSISDANAREILGFVSVATSDYKDLGGVKVASLKNVGIVAKPATGTNDIYVAVVNSTGTPTYSASGLKLRIGVIQ